MFSFSSCDTWHQCACCGCATDRYRRLVQEFQRFDRFKFIDYRLKRELCTKILEVSHGYVGFSSSSASTTHEHSCSLHCLGPSKRSPRPAMRHMPETPCALLDTLVNGNAVRAFCDLTHHSWFIRTVFHNNKSETQMSSHNQDYDNFSHPCASLSLEVPTISAVQSFSDRPFSRPSQTGIISPIGFTIYMIADFFCSPVCVCDVRQ